MIKISTKKTQANWRMLADVLAELDKDRVEKGFASIPALVNHLLARYVRGETIKRGNK